MQCEGKEESGEMSSPEVSESMLHGDMVQFTVQRIADVLNTMENMVTEPPLPQEDASLDGSLFRAPLCPAQTYSPLELVHVDFTSIEMTREPNKCRSIENVLVLTDHFTGYAMAFITKDQKAKAVTHIPYDL